MTYVSNQVVDGTIVAFSAQDRAGILDISGENREFSSQVFSGGITKKWPDIGDKVRVVLDNKGAIILVRKA